MRRLLVNQHTYDPRMHFTRSLALAVLTVLIAAACSSSSSPDEVLNDWVTSAWDGDVEAARSLTAGDDIPWLGLSATPSASVEASVPFENTNVVADCSSDQTIATCEITWNDLWIDSIPEVDQGSMRVGAEVVDGTIVAFTEWFTPATIVSLFDFHFEWLERNEPARLAATCGIEPGSAACSQLFVDTVDAWIASR